MKTIDALVSLLGRRENGMFFQRLCEEGHVALRAQAWQFRDELKEYGHHYPLPDVEDALFDLARELLPDSPAAITVKEQKDHVLKQALLYIAEHNPDVDSDPAELNAAYQTGTMAEFRAACRRRASARKAA